MIDLHLLKENPDLAKCIKLEMTGIELLDYQDELVKRVVEAKEKEENKKEEYLTPKELADILKVSLVTIWSWDRKGITQPLRIGNQKRYRRSDVEKFMQQE